MTATPVVEIVHLHKGYGATPVLRDVSLEVLPGTVTVVLGPSGSGKSTLLRTINHLEPIDSGEVRVAGELIGYRRTGRTMRELGHRQLARQRARIGMVFQDFNLFPHLTVLENVVEAPVHVRRRPRAEAEDRARRLIARVGLAGRESSYPRQLSGGQQQRIAIARALAMDPEVVLLDEPTSALDPELVGEVLDVVKDVAAGGTTLVVVTHEIGFARDVADQVVFIDGGTVVERGAPDEVLVHPRQARTRAFLDRVL